MKGFYRTAEVAKLFNIPVATLHYWESEGLFAIKKDPDNGYRVFDMSDVLNIWEVILYRNLQISLRGIRRIMDNSDPVRQGNIYAKQKRDLQQRIDRLELVKRWLGQQEVAVEMVHRLMETPFTFSEPDFSAFALDPLQLDTMQASLREPYDCGLLVDGETFVRTHRLKAGDSREPIWTQPGNGQLYAEFLLKVNIADVRDNNLAEVRGTLEAMGLRTGRVVARFLLVLGRRERRYEHYRAWIEIGK